MAVLSEDDKASIAKVTIGNATKGTAFLVHASYAITAGHVVAGATTEIKLAFPSGHECKAEVIQPETPNLDWVLLLLTPPPVDATHVRFAHIDRWQTRWITHGHGQLYKVDGGPIDGTFYTVGKALLELKCGAVDGKAPAVVEGFSGAPIITAAGVVGVARYTRGSNGGVAGGYLAAIPTRTLLESWPAAHGHAKPSPEQKAPYVVALCLELEDTRRVVRESLRKAAQLAPLDPSVEIERIAERLVQLDWDTIKEIVDKNFLPPGLRDLLCSMWVCREAAARFGEIVATERGVPVVQTKESFTIRHHAMRAQAEREVDSQIPWRKREHVIHANVGAGEKLLVAVANAIANTLQVDVDRVPEHVRQTNPVFVSLKRIPQEAEVAEVIAALGKNLRIVGFEPRVTPELLATNSNASQVKPDPDPELEEAAMTRIPKVIP